MNFKDCEVTYGSIEVLHGRDTDIMCLQEDKISYVLTGKDLLSTPAGGGAITSTPFVLGQQIARIEEYGISNNPESFAAHGDSMYFTDAKRNAVIQLKGVGRKQALIVISEQGMRSYFRDLFTNNFDKQKLGGYDPYMNEYVLSNTTTSIPSASVPISCGSLLSRQNVFNAATYTVNLGSTQGTVKIEYNVTGTINIQMVWDGNSVINQSVTGTGDLSFIKNKANPKTASLAITPSGTASFDVTPLCPETNELTVVQLTLGSPVSDGKFIHNQYFWQQSSITSPVSSELISFTTADPVESFISTTGQSSVGIIPPVGATITIQSNKKDFDDFEFDSTIHKFKYLVSQTQYTASVWQNIDALSTTVTPITSPSTGLFQASFTYNNSVPTIDKYLYLVWDYRTPTNQNLRQGSTANIACCSGSTVGYFIDTNSFATATAVYTTDTLHTPAPDQFYQTGNLVREQSGGLLLPGQTCSPCGTAVPLCYSTVSETDLCCTGCTYTAYSSSPVKSTRSEACAEAQTQTYFHNGTGSTPIVNNFVFANNTATTILSSGYYSLNSTTVIFVNSSGMVESILNC